MPGLFIKKILLDVDPVRGVTSQKNFKKSAYALCQGTPHSKGVTLLLFAAECPWGTCSPANTGKNKTPIVVVVLARC
jgi:hypothetical protein